MIFKSAPPFSFKTQAEMVLACAALHNFLRKKCRSDEFCSDEDEENENQTLEGNENQTLDESGIEENFETQEQERENARKWRATIAANMWRDATNTGTQR